MTITSAAVVLERLRDLPVPIFLLLGAWLIAGLLFGASLVSSRR